MHGRCAVKCHVWNTCGKNNYAFFCAKSVSVMGKFTESVTAFILSSRWASRYALSCDLGPQIWCGVGRSNAGYGALWALRIKSETPRCALTTPPPPPSGPGAHILLWCAAADREPGWLCAHYSSRGERRRVGGEQQAGSPGLQAP